MDVTNVNLASVFKDISARILSIHVVSTVGGGIPLHIIANLGAALGHYSRETEGQALDSLDSVALFQGDVDGGATIVDRGGRGEVNNLALNAVQGADSDRVPFAIGEADGLEVIDNGGLSGPLGRRGGSNQCVVLFLNLLGGGGQIGLFGRGGSQLIGKGQDGRGGVVLAPGYGQNGLRGVVAGIGIGFATAVGFWTVATVPVWGLGTLIIRNSWTLSMPGSWTFT